jgi:hypothetical protein
MPRAAGWSALLFAAAALRAQTPCAATMFQICELVFELNDREAEAHPDPCGSRKTR